MVFARKVAAAAAIVAVLCAWVGAQSVAAQEVAAHSFRPPFQDFDANFGNRRIPKWMIGGSSVLNENFLRLTPDRASKRGYAWHVDELGMDHFTITVYFRVSGQGQTLFGDGFALWLTQNNRYQEGSLHGHTDTFTGIGIVFDTFRNLESGHVHKDVAVIVNDGSGPYSIDAGVEPPGCDGDFRYHEGRDDFSVQARSRATITLNKGTLTVRLDPKADGTFKDCVTTYSVPIPGEWYKMLYLGVTASTGQLADNHDVIAIVTTEGDAVAPEKVSIVTPELSTGNPQIDAAIKTALLKEGNLVAEKLQQMNHQVEHQVEAIRDSIKHTIKKMQKQEQDNLRRIEQLEERLAAKVSDTVDGTMKERLERLESKVLSNVQERFTAQETAVKQQVEQVKASSGGGGGWVMPFIVLLLLFLGFAGFAVSKYKQFQKTHLP